MQPCDAQLADFIRSQVQTPIAFCVVQQPVAQPNIPAGALEQVPAAYNWQCKSQFVIDKMMSVQISRTTDRTSDTCQFTMEDDTFDYAAFRKDGQGKYTAAFQPGFINNRFNIYLGFQGPNYANPQGESGGSSMTQWGYEAVQRFVGYLQTDDNPYSAFANLKSVSLVDLTNQFQFDVYDTFPHPIYGDQTLPYFDPDYNLTNPTGDGVTWDCIGRMFTLDSLSMVYGSTHIDPEWYIDFSCGQTAQAAALHFGSVTVANVGGDVDGKASNDFVNTYYSGTGDPWWTFDYASGQTVFTDAWIQYAMSHDPTKSSGGTASISQLQTGSYPAGTNVFTVNQPSNFVVGGTITIGLSADPHQEQLQIESIQVGARTITTVTVSTYSHAAGDPVMGNYVVSMAGNPTYMSPERMIYLILVSKGNWDPSKLKLGNTNILINQYVGQDMAAWDCLKEICDLTCPRMMPWQLYVDQTGTIHFEEVNLDAPFVKKYVDNRDFLTLDLNYTSQNISTVVRAEGECYTDQGSQSVTSLAFNLKAIQRYGQTAALLLDQHLTYNCRQMTTTSAVSFMNMLTMSVLGQVSEPTLTLTAEIWPDPTLEINDKIRVTDSATGLDTDFILSAISETVGPGSYGMQITAEKAIDSANYMVGLPAAVTYDNLLLPAEGSVPSTSLVKEVRVGTGVGKFIYKDWNLQQDPITLDDMVAQWNLDGSAMNFDIFFDAKKPVTANNVYNYTNLPPNLTWSLLNGSYYALQSSIPEGSPANTGWYLCVGPDSVFYTFNHAPPITPADLTSFWLPPGNNHVPGQSQGTKQWDGYLWAWFYLNLDGSRGSGKPYRPVMLLRNFNGVTQDPPFKFSVPGGAGQQVNMTWTNGPGPTDDGHSFYYGNVVAGISNITPVPPGFYGAEVHNGGGGHRSHNTCRVNWLDSNPYDPAQGQGWMPPGQTTIPVTNAAAILPGDLVTIGTGGNQESNNGSGILVASVTSSTITLDGSYNAGQGTVNPHYGGPTGQSDQPPQSGWYTNAPQAPVLLTTGPGGGMPDNLAYGCAFGNPIGQQDVYVNYQKATSGHFCIFVMSSDGASQFIRIPFQVNL